MRAGSYALEAIQGIAPKTISASEFSASVDGIPWEYTLVVVSTGAVSGSLTITVQDSADNSSFSDVSAGLSMSATSTYLILVKHSSLRRYVRVHAEGVTSPVASVSMVRINDQSGELVGGCDTVVG
jgi:hypothetical protein